MATETAAEPDLLGALDFDVACEARGCDLPAEWCGLELCKCGRTYFGCDRHVQQDMATGAQGGPLICRRCGTTAPSYADMFRWHPLRGGA